ncbi:MAG TPA: hypothetical protein VFB60_08155 [Ktedonobacteraceae bacterium]|nr:hypothetical protein [Ktedonobacteraceae bacterium]
MTDPVNTFGYSLDILWNFPEFVKWSDDYVRAIYFFFFAPFGGEGGEE